MSDGAAHSAAGWVPVHRVLFDGVGTSGVDGLYARGPLTLKSRDSATLIAGATASFATYFGAFPAMAWVSAGGERRVRLSLDAGSACRVTLFRTDTAGNVFDISSTDVEGGRFTTDLTIEATWGWAWLEVTAAERDVELSSIVWSLPEIEGDRHGMTVCITTHNREDYCIRLLERLASEADALRIIDRIVVVDQGDNRVANHAGFDVVSQTLGPVLSLVEQANLGGSGGYSRGMLEALDGDSTYVLLMDDDVDIDPESLVRLHAFAERSSRTTVVGSHMLSLVTPTELHSWGERVDLGSFWWTPVDPALTRLDVARNTPDRSPELSKPLSVDFSGWWMCLIPLDTIRRSGLSLPYFIKWDDAEFGLRAARDGSPTVMLPGAAIWHMPWTHKDNGLDWQAYFQLRNRIASALIHAPKRTKWRLLASTFAQDTNHLLCMQYGSVEVRHLALRDILSGPDHLPATISRRRADADRILERAGQRALTVKPPVVDLGGTTKPLPLAASLRVIWRQLQRTPRAPSSRADVPNHQAKWWNLGSLDAAVMAGASGLVWFALRRNRRKASRLLVETVRLHLTLLLRWASLKFSYRRSAAHTASAESWRRLIEESDRAERAGMPTNP